MLNFNCFTRLAGAAALAGVLAVTAVGCRNLPGSPGAQGATIGGVGGAAAGAAVAGEHNRLLGAIIGGALGAGGGYVVGAHSDRILGKDRAGAEEAERRAQTSPATAQQAINAPTADLNNDGFVTMDEVVAMRNAGLTRDQMVAKLRATGQVFDLTPEQKNYLTSRGVDPYVVDAMNDINRETRDRLLTPSTTPDTTGSSVIGRQRPAGGSNQ